jgi:hypothetical protein
LLSPEFEVTACGYAHQQADVARIGSGFSVAILPLWKYGLTKKPDLGSGPINFRSTFLVESGVSDW